MISLSTRSEFKTRLSKAAPEEMCFQATAEYDTIR